MSGFPWGSLATELALCTLGLVLLVLDVTLNRRQRAWLGPLTMGGLLLCLVPAAGVCAPNTAQPALFGGLYMSDNFHTFFRLLAVIQAVLVVILSLDYLEHIRVDRGVYFALIVFGTLAMVLLAGANDLVMIYLTIEYLSVTSYILAGFLLGRDRGSLGEIKRSIEASLKYLIYGAVASGVMLYGFSLLYGLSGTTSLHGVATVFEQPGNELVKLVAVLFSLVGLGFKISAVPFHQWAPDVYEGAPTPVAAFLAVGSKSAALALFTRFFVIGLAGYQPQWAGILAVIAVVTMFAGNLLALLQDNVKRMLAYSSVAHAGYLLVGVICNRPDGEGIKAVLIYLAAYLFMTMGAFAVVVWHGRRTGSERIPDFAGLAQREPGVALLMLIFMLSLTGIPPTIGFVGKMWLFLAAVPTAYWWLGLMIVVNSAISLVYYINVVRVMFFLPPEQELKQRPAFWSLGVAWICGLATIALMLGFGVILDLVQEPMKAFVGG